MLKKEILRLVVKCKNINVPIRQEINDKFSEIQNDYEVHQVIREEFDGINDTWYASLLVTKKEK